MPRLSLGAILLAACGSRNVYWEDLRRNKENGWALYGLMQALNAQGKNDDAA